VKALKDGTLSVMDFIAVMSLEGRVFSAAGGSGTSPITFGAGTIDTTEPDLMIKVPSGTSIIPVEINLTMEAYGTTAIFEFMASIGQGSTTALGTDTDVTIYNCNLGNSVASACSAGAASNNDATYMTDNVVEFWRGCEGKAVTVATADDDSTWQPVNFSWKLTDAGYLPICNGEGGLTVFAASQAGTGFIQCRFIEIPTNWLE